MKSLLSVHGLAAALVSAGTLAVPAFAQDEHKSVCLPAYNIDHTEIKDKSTLLFYMKGGKVWENKLPYPCVSLWPGRGFAFTPTDPGSDEICDNLVTFYARPPNGNGIGFRNGEACPAGAFTPYTPAPAQSQAPPPTP